MSYREQQQRLQREEAFFLAKNAVKSSSSLVVLELAAVSQPRFAWLPPLLLLSFSTKHGCFHFLQVSKSRSGERGDFLLAIFCWHLHRSFCDRVVHWWEWQIRRLSNTKLTAVSWSFSSFWVYETAVLTAMTLYPNFLFCFMVTSDLKASWGHPYCIALTCRKTSFAIRGIIW